MVVRTLGTNMDTDLGKRGSKTNDGLIVKEKLFGGFRRNSLRYTVRNSVGGRNSFTIRVTFRLATSDRRSSLEILPWIEATVRNVGRDYPAVKTALLDTVGFDSARLVGTVQFAPMKSIEELIDHTHAHARARAHVSLPTLATFAWSSRAEAELPS